MLDVNVHSFSILIISSGDGGYSRAVSESETDDVCSDLPVFYGVPAQSYEKPI